MPGVEYVFRFAVLEGGRTPTNAQTIAF